MGIFAQDQWTIKRLTANYGVRARLPEGAASTRRTSPAGPFTPAAQFRRRVRTCRTGRTSDPRFGVAYDLFGNGKTALKASIGRYVVADAYTIARAVNPVQSSVNSVTTDVGRRESERHVQPVQRLRPHQLRRATAASRAGRCGAIATRRSARWRRGRRTTIPTSSRAGASGRTTGRPRSSIQREIVPRVSVYAGYSRRWFGNLLATHEPGRDQCQLHAVLHACRFPSIPAAAAERGGTQCGLFDINPSDDAEQPDHQSAEQLRRRIEDVYDGFDFNVNARVWAGACMCRAASASAASASTAAT